MSERVMGSTSYSDDMKGPHGKKVLSCLNSSFMISASQQSQESLDTDGKDTGEKWSDYPTRGKA
jgi:hypothetical protein